jgi:hypothetical protein
MDRRRYSTMLVLAAAALVAEACSSGSGTKGTGGADGGSSSGGATGTGGKADAGTGGVTGTGGKVDAGTGGMTSTDASDAPKDMSVADTGTDTVVDATADADPASSEKMLCATSPYSTNAAPPFSPLQFCTLYREICNNIVGARVFATEGDCETAYSGFNTDPDAGAGTEGPNGQKGCRTQHLCLANVSAANALIHCPHTTGLANNDAGPGGPCP